jgi:hypothetical protein
MLLLLSLSAISAGRYVCIPIRLDWNLFLSIWICTMCFSDTIHSPVKGLVLLQIDAHRSSAHGSLEGDNGRNDDDNALDGVTNSMSHGVDLSKSKEGNFIVGIVRSSTKSKQSSETLRIQLWIISRTMPSNQACLGNVASEPLSMKEESSKNLDTIDDDGCRLLLFCFHL